MTNLVPNIIPRLIFSLIVAIVFQFLGVWFKVPSVEDIQSCHMQFLYFWSDPWSLKHPVGKYCIWNYIGPHSIRWIYTFCSNFRTFRADSDSGVKSNQYSQTDTDLTGCCGVYFFGYYLCQILQQIIWGLYSLKWITLRLITVFYRAHSIWMYHEENNLYRQLTWRTTVIKTIQHYCWCNFLPVYSLVFLIQSKKTLTIHIKH